MILKLTAELVNEILTANAKVCRTFILPPDGHNFLECLSVFVDRDMMNLKILPEGQLTWIRK
jgi:hypothetical protein